MKLNIVQLYPDYLNMYGDYGNILSLKNRAKWRGIDVTVTRFDIDDELNFEDTDIIYIGGGTDKAQKLSCERLLKYKEKLKSFAENNGVILAVSNGFELLGNYFTVGDEKTEALGIVDMHSDFDSKRFIGDIIINSSMFSKPIVGFENHGGRVNIKNNTPLGTVAYGNGNNGNDKTEGVVYKNVFGTYIHGPLLPKNPHLCDEILKRALKTDALSPLDDTVENLANEYVCKRFLGND